MRRAHTAPALVALATAATAAALIAAAAADDAPKGSLSVLANFDESNGLYVEGAVPFVRVRDARGRVVLHRRLSFGGPLRVRLRRGRYRLAAYERPCEGNCG